MSECVVVLRTKRRAAPFVSLNKVAIRLFDKLLFKDVTWQVRTDEQWAVVGPNGSGKSTLIKALCGEALVVRGEIVYHFAEDDSAGDRSPYGIIPEQQIAHVSFEDQRNLILSESPYHQARWNSAEGEDVPTVSEFLSIESIWDIKKKIGWVSPDIQIHYDDDVTVWRVVCSGFFDTIGLYRRCSAEQRQKAREWMRVLELGDLASKPFGELSAGQQRMVVLARALVKGPSLLVLDEPCQGLDFEHRETALRLIGLVGRKTSTNLIYVTHHVDEVPSCVTHVLRLRKGSVARRGRRRGAI